MKTGAKTSERFFGAAEFELWLDHLARAILGVSGEEFIEGYERGVFGDSPAARSLATVIPLIEAGRSAAS